MMYREYLFRSKRLLVVFLLAIWPAMSFSQPVNEKVFLGLEVARENKIEEIDRKEKTIIVGDKVFYYTSLIPIRYSNASVASVLSLRVGQWVKVYVSSNILENSQPPYSAEGIEIMLQGDPGI